MRAIGCAPAASPALRLATIIATAPSLMPEALPAVVTPSLNSGRSLASAAMSVLRPRVLVLRDRHRTGAAARHLDRDDLAGEEPVGLGGGVFALRAGGEGVGLPRA